MTTENYHVFYQVVEYGSISKAAAALYVSQPAVSKAIKVLEEGLGLVLFKRTAKGVRLTQEGEILYKYVAVAITQLQEGEKRVKQLLDRSYGSIRIGISNTLCKYYFLSYLEAFHETFPKLKIQIINRTSPETLKLLEEGKIDCAIISQVEIKRGFIYEELMQIQDIFISKEKPPKERLLLKDLEAYPMLLLERKNATREHLETFLIANQIQLDVDIEISSMDFLVEFTRIGLGVASVIGNFVQDELEKKDFYEWPTTPSIPKRSIGLLYSEGKMISLACQTFVDFILQEKRKRK